MPTRAIRVKRRRIYNDGLRRPGQLRHFNFKRFKRPNFSHDKFVVASLERTEIEFPLAVCFECLDKRLVNSAAWPSIFVQRDLHMLSSEGLS